MSQARESLALRRRQLVIRSTQVREQLVVQSTALLPLLAVGDRVRAAFLWVRQHPGVVLAFTVAVVITRPRTAWRWGVRVGGDCCVGWTIGGWKVDGVPLASW